MPDECDQLDTDNCYGSSVTMKKSALIAMAVFSIAAANANATVIISPTTASASSEFGADFDIGNTMDQSGLFSGFVSGVTDFDTPISVPTRFITISPSTMNGLRLRTS
jgi:hypothetical protein